VYALAAARAYLGASLAEAAALGKPVLVEEFGWPRDLGSVSVASATHGRDAMYAMVFDLLLASAETHGALAGASFWGYAGSGRPEYAVGAVPATAAEICASSEGGAASSLRNFAGGRADWAACFFDEGARPEACPFWTWWAPPAAAPNATFRGSSTLVHDPPHETQGWYSVYDSDASTMAVVATAARRLAALQACASVAVQSVRAAERADGFANSGLYGAAACVAALGPPPEAAAAPPRARACAAAGGDVAAAAPAPAFASLPLLTRSNASRGDAAFWAHMAAVPPAGRAAAPAPAAALGADVPEADMRRFAPPN
jgi:hypothetical protein